MRRRAVLTVVAILVVSSLLAVYGWERFSARPSGNLSAEVAISSVSWVGNSSTAHCSVGVPYTFSAVVSGGASPYEENWNFGDGTEGNGPSVIHLYCTQRVTCYNGSLTVTDSSGALSTADYTINVHTGAIGTRSGGNAAGTLPSHFSVC